MPDRFDVAASYLARIQSGTDSVSARRELDAWRNAAPENQDAADSVFAAWDAAGSAETSSEVQQMLADMRARYNQPAQDRGGVWNKGAWRGWAIAAGLAVMLSIPATLWMVDHRRADNSAQRQEQSAAIDDATRIANTDGGRRTVRLDDGSRITLDVGSAVRVSYSTTHRAVTMEKGRAHFAVHKDKQRPFIVTAGRLTATAVGTAFDVRLSTGHEEVMTSEGVVRVVTQLPAGAGGYATLLNAGMKLTQKAASVVLAPIDVVQETAWTDGKIIFSAHCLLDVARQMNPYGRSSLVVDGDAANIAISGVFDLDNGEGLAEALEHQGLTHMRHDGSRIFLSRADGAAPAACRTRASSTRS